MYICISKCIELDREGVAHCRVADPDSMWERYPDGCPCGNTPTFVEEEESADRRESSVRH